MSLAAKIWERSRDWVMFLVLFAISVGTLINNDDALFRTIRATSLAVTAHTEGIFSTISRFRGALGENERLQNENIELSTEVARLREARAENERLRTLLSFGDTLAYAHVPARVVAKDITQQENYLTLHVGATDRIEIGMPVIDERGIVGKVVLVGRNHIMVMPHQSTQFAVPATIDALQQDGIVRWDGAEYGRLLMEYVPKTEGVEPGQLVTTSSYSGVFPSGFPIGVVDTVFTRPGRNDFMIYLQPSAPISRVNFVYVLLSERDPEIGSLQNDVRQQFSN